MKYFRQADNGESHTQSEESAHVGQHGDVGGDNVSRELGGKRLRYVDVDLQKIVPAVLHQGIIEDLGVRTIYPGI